MKNYKMNIDNFENYIDKKILERGYDYYENDYVASVGEIDCNVYEAKVEGTELYTVEVEIDNEVNIVKTECNCPYDMGEYCKHQVAVFLAIRDIKNNDSNGNNYIPQKIIDPEATTKLKISTKRKANDIEKILSDRSKNELVEFLLEIASEYEEIKQRIELNFDNENDEEEIAKSIALIRVFIRNNSDRDGFVAYGDTVEAVKGADLVLGKAHFAFEENKPMHAVQLALCVTREMVDLIQEADDSDGIIGGAIEESFSFISEVIDDTGLNSVDKESIFHMVIEESVNRRYEGWIDWRLDLLQKCSELADTLNLKNELEKYLLSLMKSEKGDSWSVNYLAEKINLIRYRMALKYDGQKKAQEFIEQNLQYSTFRQMAIEIAMKNKEYDNVITLTHDGEEKDKSLPGLKNKWKNYRYEAFQLLGKVDEQRIIAMDFILSGSIEYYNEIKSTYDTKEWIPVHSKIISLLESQKKTHLDVYTHILIEEGEKQKLLEYVKVRPSSVEIYYKHLIPEFKKEVYMLFLQYIEQSAERSSNRKDYQGVCAIIQNLKKAGGKEPAMEIKQKLFNKYANRPAFRDELSRV